jgi:hypothetical protein
MTKPENTDSQNFSPREDLPAYALNALTADERRRVEAYLSQYPEAWEELVQYLEAVEHIGLNAPAPAAELILQVRENIISQADRDIFLTRLAQKEARSARPGLGKRVFGAWLRPARVAYAGASAALMAVIGLSIVFGLENSQLKSEIDTLRTDISSESARLRDLRDSVEANSQLVASQESEVARLTAVNAALNEALKNQQWLTYVTENEQFRVSDLFTGGPQAPEATGTLSVNENSADQAVLLVMGLPPAPDGYQYQLWLVRDSVAEPMASFQVNAAGMARVEFILPTDINMYESAIVTRERTGVEDTGMPGAQVMTASER